jgi:hypothetical protein
VAVLLDTKTDTIHEAFTKTVYHSRITTLVLQTRIQSPRYIGSILQDSEQSDHGDTKPKASTSRLEGGSSRAGSSRSATRRRGR